MRKILLLAMLLPMAAQAEDYAFSFDHNLKLFDSTSAEQYREEKRLDEKELGNDGDVAFDNAAQHDAIARHEHHSAAYWHSKAEQDQ